MNLKSILKRFESIFIFLQIAVTFLSIYLIKDAYYLRKELEISGIEYKPLSHLWYMFFSIIFVGIFKRVALIPVKPYLLKMVEQNNPKHEWKQKKEKLEYYVIGLIWYSFSNFIGLYLSYNSPATPSQLLGIGPINIGLKNYPGIDKIPFATEYYML